MKKSKISKLAIIITAFALLLTGCTSPSNEIDDQEKEAVEDSTVEITDLHGKVTVPVNPKKVVALDNRTFETLADWGIELAAVPKSVMPADSPYVKDELVEDIGNHREPNLEIIAAVDPELVIVGQRFASFYEDIKELVPNAVVIDLNFDVSESANNPGENLVNGLKNSTIALGQIFDKNEEAEKLVSDFNQSIEDVKSSYNGKDTIMSIVVSGGDIGFSGGVCWPGAV